jgi:hypothetical protein
MSTTSPPAVAATTLTPTACDRGSDGGSETVASGDWLFEGVSETVAVGV